MTFNFLHLTILIKGDHLYAKQDENVSGVRPVFCLPCISVSLPVGTIRVGCPFSMSQLPILYTANPDVRYEPELSSK